MKVCTRDDCDKPRVARGLCQSHYGKWHHSHKKDPAVGAPEAERHYVRGTPEQRWHAKYVEDADTGCWLWIGSPNYHGYGTFDRGDKRVYAHRFGYELLVGPIPEGMQLDHLCRVRICVCPHHLQPVTPQENQRRARHTHCHRGHELTVENFVGGTRRHGCKICHRDRQRAYYQQKVTAA